MHTKISNISEGEEREEERKKERVQDNKVNIKYKHIRSTIMSGISPEMSAFKAGDDVMFHKVVKRRYTNYVQTKKGVLVHKSRVYHLEYEPYMTRPDVCAKSSGCRCECPLVNDWERNIDPVEASMYESEGYSSPEEGTLIQLDSDGVSITTTVDDDEHKAKGRVGDYDSDGVSIDFTSKGDEHERM